MSSDASAGGAPGTAATEYDKGNYEERIRREPDFALGQVKEAQRKLNELTETNKRSEGQLSQLKPLADAASLVGQGNLEYGVTQLVSLADKGYRIGQDPKLSRIFDEYVSSGKLPAAAEDDDAYLTPTEKEIRELRQTVTRLEGETSRQSGEVAIQRMQSNIETFFENDDLGRALDPAMRAEMFKTLSEQFQTWSRTADGRRQLQGLDAKSIRVIALNQLADSGKLYEVADRARAAKERGGQQDWGGPRIASSATEQVPEFKSAKEALGFAARKFGVDL